MKSQDLLRWRPLACAAVTALGTTWIAIPSVAAEIPPTVPTLPTVEVVGTTPLPGMGTPLRDVPANVQIFSAEDLAKQRRSSLVDYLAENSTSVTANSSQGNPFQMDINFRGFTASPLLGTPQGISVFQDGVRVNEPFGDVVNWDLIPSSAIAGMQIIPGSNPVFGLNTLGGAIAIETKNGRDYPGGAVQVSAGSFGRATTEFEWGDTRGPFDYFLTGNFFEDDGWADHNASRVKQYFGKIGWRDDRSRVELSLTGADNKLQGTQTLPVSFLDSPKKAYTFPDANVNQLAFATIKGSHFVNDRTLLGGTIYYRKYQNANLSSNVNHDFGEIDPGTGATDTVQAANDRLVVDQASYGLGLQLTLNGVVADRDNQIAIGASGDFGRARLTRESQDAQFTAARGTLGIGNFETQTDARTANVYYGLFVTDTLNLDRRWSLTLAARYNRAEVKVADLTGSAPLLDGTHTFARINPAVGLNFNPSERFTTYATYNEGMRAPTPIELTCADANAPCRLPNDFLADPSLEKVVAKTFEIGARGKWNRADTWSASAYRTDLDDDILFIGSADAFGAGHFANVGHTRRQGIELAMATRVDRLSVLARYSYVNATFQSNFIENSPNNSSADANGNIDVRTDDRIPAVPRHALKLRVDYDFAERWTAGAALLWSGGVYARGDENNADRNGKVPGYAVMNVNARRQITPRLEFFGRIDNVFDRRYANFGTLGENFFTGPNRTFGPAVGVDPQPEQFRGLGAPRGIWIGLRYGLNSKSDGHE
jgi:iron complex outermembrane receptor protein